MRLDARRGDTNWTVFHVRECRALVNVLWVDDVTAQWCELTAVGRLGELTGPVHQATLIRIIPARRLVLIDPVDDAEDTVDSSLLVEPVVAK